MDQVLTPAPTEPKVEAPKVGTDPRNLSNEQLDKILAGGEEKKPEVVETPKEESKTEEGQETVAEPTESKETVEGLFAKSGDKYEEVKWEDLEIPLKHKGKIIDKPYKEVVNLAQLGLDAELKYQAVKDIKAENEYFRKNYEGIVQQNAIQLAKQMFEAEIQRLETENGEEAVDNKSKAAIARERLREQQLQSLQEKLDRLEAEGSQKSAQAQKAQDAQIISKISNEVFSSVEKRFVDDKESYGVFKDLVSADAVRTVKARFEETGQTVSFDEFKEILEESVRNRFKSKIFSKPLAQKPLPKAGPVASGNGSSAINAPKISNKKLLSMDGIKSLSNEEIDRLGR